MKKVKRCMGCVERDILIRDLHWMARRYADGRSTYAVGIVNDTAKWMLKHAVYVNYCAEGIIWARDGMGRLFDGLTDREATPGTPEAKGEKWAS